MENTALPLPIKLPQSRIALKPVLRRLGYPPRMEAMDESIRAIFDSEMEKARDLIRPEAMIRFLKILNHGRKTTEFEYQFTLRSEKVAALLKTAGYGAFFFVTIGDGLEKEADRLNMNGDMTRALILDTLGSEAVDGYADMLQREIIREKAGENGFTITPRFSPGYADWPLTVQPELAELCGASKIGIEITDVYLMLPRKSVSAVFGLV